MPNLDIAFLAFFSAREMEPVLYIWRGVVKIVKSAKDDVINDAKAKRDDKTDDGTELNNVQCNSFSIDDS